MQFVRSLFASVPFRLCIELDRQAGCLDEGRWGEERDDTE